MFTNKFSYQFIRDGIVGLIIVFIIFMVLIGILLSFNIRFSSIEFWIFIKQLFIFPKTFLSIVNGQKTWHIFFSPMPLITLITFYATGSSGKFFEEVSSRASWMKPIIIVASKSWLAGIVIWPFLLIMALLLAGSIDAIHFSVSIPLLFGGFGAIIGSFTGFIIGFVFNPDRQFYKIIIAGITSACVSYVIGAGILLQQWVQ